MTTIHFKDVSHYQGNYHPDGPTIAKATEGTAFVDERYATNKSRTLAGGWPFAGYHFLTTAAASPQARHAFASIGKTPAMLDVESGTSGSPSLSLTLAFIDAYRALGGVLYLVYIPKWYWSGAWHSASLKPLIDRGMALISSQYTHYSDTGPGWDPYGGMTPSIWQYTSTPIDTNAFKGTEAQLDELFSYGPKGQPNPPASGGDEVSGELSTQGVHDIWHQDELAVNGVSKKQSAAGGVEEARDNAAAALAAAQEALAAVKAVDAKLDEVLALLQPKQP